MAPLVSVVLPVLNGERLLGQAIESLLAQTLTDFEIIAVDDGSTDSSPLLLEQFRALDPRLRVLRLEHGGLAAALNAGCGAAEGRYLARMDADDVSLRDRLERQVSILEAQPHLGLLGGQAYRISTSGRTLGTTSYPTEDEDIRAALLFGNCIAHPTVVMRVEAFRSRGGYRSAFAAGSDYDLWLRMAESWSIGNLAAPVLHYRIHGGQMSEQILEQQVLGDLAAQHAARIRRATGNDPLEAVKRIDREVLISMGVADSTVRTKLAMQLLGRTRDFMEDGDHREADRLLRRALVAAWSSPARRHLVGETLRMFAQNFTAQKRSALALAALVAGCALEPTWAPRQMARKLRS